MNKNFSKASVVSAIAVATALTASSARATEQTPHCTAASILNAVPDNTVFESKVELGAKSVGDSDIGFFGPSTKVVRDSSITGTFSFGGSLCGVKAATVTSNVTETHAVGPGIFPAAATGLGLIGDGALTRPATSSFSFTGGNSISTAGANANAKGGNATAKGGNATAYQSQNQFQQQQQQQAQQTKVNQSVANNTKPSKPQPKQGNGYGNQAPQSW